MKLYIHLFLFLLFFVKLFAQTGVEEINVVVQSGSFQVFDIFFGRVNSGLSLHFI